VNHNLPFSSKPAPIGWQRRAVVGSWKPGTRCGWFTPANIYRKKPAGQILRHIEFQGQLPGLDTRKNTFPKIERGKKIDPKILNNHLGHDSEILALANRNA
jgi:hypothetical protein